jgi:GNAT superfamily N-acetyltransferase
MRVRTVAAHRPGDFGRPGPGFTDRGAQVRRLWDGGVSRPQWCFLGERAGRVVARVGFAVGHDPLAVPDSRHPATDLLAATLRRVPPEVTVFALDHRAGYADAAGRLLRAAIGLLPVPAGTVVEARVNPETHRDPAGRRRILTAGGLSLFQEKQGYAWSAGWGRSPVPSGLDLEPVSRTGVGAFLDVMGRATGDTLDRNDRYYRELCGPAGWARVMAEYLTPDAEGTWCLAADGDGETVGYVAVSAFPEPATATITHLGVLPGHRGHGHGRRLVGAGTALAADAGFTAMINEVDVGNAPMVKAFLSAGHRDDARPWHVWHYRAVTGGG